MDHFRVQLRVVFYQEEGFWLAHNLETDVIGQGQTRHEAFESLNAMLRDQIQASIESGNNANIFQPADGRYFQMFAAGKDCIEGDAIFPIENLPADFEVQSVEAREYAPAA